MALDPSLDYSPGPFLCLACGVTETAETQAETAGFVAVEKQVLEFKGVLVEDHRWVWQETPSGLASTCTSL